MAFIIKERSPKVLEEFLPCLKAHEQRKYINSIITCITKHYLKTTIESKEDVPIRSSVAISSVAYLLHCLIRNNEVLKDHIVTILVQPSVPALDESLPARRGLLAAIAQDEGKHNISEMMQTLIASRQTTNIAREEHQSFWRFVLRQAYSHIATRK